MGDGTPSIGDLEVEAAALAADLSATGLGRDCARHAERLRFALARVEELRVQARAAGGVFVPARLAVAEQILAGHVARARSHAGRAPRPAHAGVPEALERRSAA